jgi:hypothetical protein
MVLHLFQAGMIPEQILYILRKTGIKRVNESIIENEMIIDCVAELKKYSEYSML